MIINILGTDYTIVRKSYNSCGYFEQKGWGAYCDFVEKEIVLCDLTTHPIFVGDSDNYIKKSENINLRHEIIHAYLYESGLDSNSSSSGCWAMNEEMVDWIALQFNKILRTYKKLNLIEED